MNATNPELGMPIYLKHSDDASALEHEFAARCAMPSDINEHLPLLKRLASECTGIAEFGVRTGNSTIAFLAGLEANRDAVVKRVLWSYDIELPQFQPPALPPDVEWRFDLRDTAHLGRLPFCDLLFVDTAHTRVHVAAELQYHRSVARYIVFHDTTLWGLVGMDGKTGVLHAALDFLATNPDWHVQEHRLNNNGLLVLRRRLAQ